MAKKPKVPKSISTLKHAQLLKKVKALLVEQGFDPAIKVIGINLTSGCNCLDDEKEVWEKVGDDWVCHCEPK